MAIANWQATDKLNGLIGCLRLGSVNLNNGAPANDVKLFSSASPDQPVRVAYCSFFESRLLDYQDALYSMLRQASRDDQAIQLLENAIAGTNVLSFSNVVSSIVQLAGAAIHDERVLRAFTADALELEYFIYQPFILGPDQVYSDCSQYASANCNDLTGVRPERADIDSLRQWIATESAQSLRPTIRVWHFQEVEAFMISACASLADNTQCSAELPFGIPPQGGVTSAQPRTVHSGAVAQKPKSKNQTGQPGPSNQGAAPGCSVAIDALKQGSTDFLNKAITAESFKLLQQQASTACASKEPKCVQDISDFGQASIDISNGSPAETGKKFASDDMKTSCK